MKTESPSFDNNTGGFAASGLIGGAFGLGSVYELPSGGATFATLASFGSSTSPFLAAFGSDPEGAVVLDKGGDVLGVNSGGLTREGTIFELSPSTPSRIAFIEQPANSYSGDIIQAAGNFTNFVAPLVTVAVQDASGRLVTTQTPDINVALGSGPGATLNGTLIQTAQDGFAGFPDLSLDTAGTYTLSATAGSLTGVQSNSFTVTQPVLAFVNPLPAVPTVADGTLTSTVSATFTASQDPFVTLGTFSGSGGQGAFPDGTPIMDGNGNLFGTTYGGGDAKGDGTVFEITHGSNQITTLAQFNGSDGSGPFESLASDTSGDLFGTASGGGDANGDGTVFEVVTGSNAITLLAAFNGSNGSDPNGGVVLDQTAISSAPPSLGAPSVTAPSSRSPRAATPSPRSPPSTAPTAILPTAD